MGFALLGDIMLGNSLATGPTKAQETSKVSLVQHRVAKGKPVVQDVGDELDTKSMDFFFDETFCDPLTEMGKLEAAKNSRQPLSYVGGDGSFLGRHYVVEDFEVTTLKTTPSGRTVRMEMSVSLLEIPMLAPLDFLASLARAAAPALMRLDQLLPFGAKK